LLACVGQHVDSLLFVLTGTSSSTPWLGLYWSCNVTERSRKPGADAWQNVKEEICVCCLRSRSLFNSCGWVLMQVPGETEAGQFDDADDDDKLWCSTSKEWAQRGEPRFQFLVHAGCWLASASGWHRNCCVLYVIYAIWRSGVGFDMWSLVLVWHSANPPRPTWAVRLQFGHGSCHHSGCFL
jgi:hypothetical protein